MSDADAKALRALLAAWDAGQAVDTRAAVTALPGLLDEVERLRNEVASEREACAALCDAEAARWRGVSLCDAEAVSSDLARAIRARGGR